MPTFLRVGLEDDGFLPVDIADLLHHFVQLGILGVLIVGLYAEEFLEAPVMGLRCLDLVCRVEDIFAQ